MKRLIMLCLVVLMAVIGGCATVPADPRVTFASSMHEYSYHKLAIFVVDRVGIRNGDRQAVEDEFMRAAMDRGYRVAARSDIDRIARSLKFDRQQLSDHEIAEIGRKLDVPIVVVVSVNAVSTKRTSGNNPCYRTTVAISARMVAVDKVEVIWLGDFTGQDWYGVDRGYAVQKVIKGTARKVASGLPYNRN